MKKLTTPKRKETLKNINLKNGKFRLNIAEILCLGKFCCKTNNTKIYDVLKKYFIKMLSVEKIMLQFIKIQVIEQIVLNDEQRRVANSLIKAPISEIYEKDEDNWNS